MSEELDPDRISRLIVDFVAGTLSPDDAQILRRWADSSLQNKELLEVLGDPQTLRTVVGQVCSYDAEKGWQRVERRSRRRKIMRLVYPLAGVAAVVAVVAGAFFFPQKPTMEPVIPQLPRQNEVAAVRLYRASGEVVVVDSARRIDLGNAIVESNAQGMQILSQNDKLAEHVAVYNTVEVPCRKTFDITLSDGTQVTLNAGSSLRFPERFAEHAPREVYLTGEGYFTVSKDERHPFIVHTGTGYVRVTGTQFDVNSYEDMPAAVTTLVEGRVLVGGVGADREIPLMPGMQAVQDRQTGAVTTCNVDVSDFTAWKTGVFSFRERPLKEIVQTLSRWYGCRVVFGDEARADVSFSGDIARSCSLEEVAEFFRRTKEVDITVENGVLVVN